jgi:serine/threonine-protein kinase RsbW
MISQKHELSIASDPSNITLVESFVDVICRKLEIKEELYGNVLISITEAVNNAIVHGNQSDRAKKVSVFLKEKSDKALVFEIRDEGVGFDYENIPDPTAPENLEKLSGRGIFLMKQLSDHVDFLDNGQAVLVKFDIV